MRADARRARYAARRARRSGLAWYWLNVLPISAPARSATKVVIDGLMTRNYVVRARRESEELPNFRVEAPYLATSAEALTYASASIVTIGLTPEADGNAEASATTRPRVPATSPSSSHTEPIAAVPIWWNEYSATRPATQPAASAAVVKSSIVPEHPGAYSTRREWFDTIRFAPAASSTHAAACVPARSRAASRSERRYRITGRPSRPTRTSPASKSRRSTPTSVMFGSHDISSACCLALRHGAAPASRAG